MLNGPGFRLNDQIPNGTFQSGTIFSHILPRGWANRSTTEAEIVMEGVRKVYKVFRPLTTMQKTIASDHIRRVRTGSVGSFSPRPMPAARRTSIWESVSARGVRMEGRFHYIIIRRRDTPTITRPRGLIHVFLLDINVFCLHICISLNGNKS